MADIDSMLDADISEISEYLDSYLDSVEDLIDKHYLVYAHVLPNKKAYIGMTGTSVQQRSGTNGSFYKNHQPQMLADIQALGGWDKVKHYTLMQGLTHEEALLFEGIFSYIFEKAGYTLYNIYFNYKEFHHTDETKLKIQCAGMGRTHTEESKQKMSNVLKGKVRTEQQKEAARQRMLSYYTEEMRKVHSQLCSEGNRLRQCGKPRSDETKRKLSQKFSGRTMSLEWRNKISEGLKGNIPSNRRKIIATYSDGSQKIFDALTLCDAYFNKYRGWTLRNCGTNKFTPLGVKLDYYMPEVEK